MDGARLSPQLLLRPRGLGTFLGVFVPCTCTIFGVVVFLRLGFVVGQAGLYCALLIVLASYAICLLTTLSLCALIADGDDRHRRGSVSDTGSPAKDPGVYAALRQAVGTPLGGALGLAFYLAFTVDVAFYIIGFVLAARVLERVAPVVREGRAVHRGALDLDVVEGLLRLDDDLVADGDDAGHL